MEITEEEKKEQKEREKDNTDGQRLRANGFE